MIDASAAASPSMRAMTILATTLAISAQTALAQPPPDYFRGKTITIIVGTGEGGPYAIGAQLLARQWSKHIAGNPTIIVQSMPGGGGLKMAAWLQHVATRDGTVVGMPVQTVAMAQVLEPKDAQYDVRIWPWIGNMAVLRHHGDTELGPSCILPRCDRRPNCYHSRQSSCLQRPRPDDQSRCARRSSGRIQIAG